MPSAVAREATAAEPPAVTTGQPSAAARPQVPAPRAEPPQSWPWPGRPAAAPASELDGVVDALIASWRPPEAGAQPEPEPLVEAGL